VKHAWTLPAALAIALALYVRVARPDHTETRLLLDFWPVWLLCVALVAVALAWTRRG
jgi:hypothetical protein